MTFVARNLYICDISIDKCHRNYTHTTNVYLQPALGIFNRSVYLGLKTRCLYLSMFVHKKLQLVLELLSTRLFSGVLPCLACSRSEFLQKHGHLKANYYGLRNKDAVILGRLGYISFNGAAFR